MPPTIINAIINAVKTSAIIKSSTDKPFWVVIIQCSMFPFVYADGRKNK